MIPTRTVLILAGGALEDLSAVGPLPDHEHVIAADSGLAQAAPLELAVDVVVGDLDSVGSAAVVAAEAAGATVERHPTDKDATDLELALDVALQRDAARAIVIGGGGGGRVDHLLANALLLGAGRFAGLDLEWRTGRYRTVVVRRRTEIAGTAGDLVSLLPVGGPACGITTTGLRWSLHDKDLPPGSTRGVSNELAAPVATISLRSGTLLAMHRGSR